MSGLSPDEIERDLEETKAVFALHDIKLKGFRSPQSRWTFKQMEVYLNHGLRWSAENDDAAFPYVLKKNHSNCLFRMPVVMDDWKFESLNVTPSMMLENLTRRLDLLCDKNSYGAIGFHPWVLGKSEDKLNMFEKFISILSDRKDVTVCTFDSIYKLIIEGRIDS
jgi:peptidoglycan/xylan/chitin deacetylase (PgdA/CDA1 family)